MSWIPIAAWLAALVVTAIVLGFCAYEIIWKARRLQGHLVNLLGLGDALSQLQGEATAVQRRMARPGVS